MNFWYNETGDCMARYELVAYDKTTNQEYIIPLKNKGADKVSEKNDLFEIDAVTSQYKNLYELQKELVRKNCIPTDVVDLKIRYFHNREEKFLTVIVDSPLIYQICVSLVQKKNNKRKIDVDVLSSFVRPFYFRILSYMSSKETSDLFLQNDYNLIPYFLRENTLSYVMLCQKNFLTFEEFSDKCQLEKLVIYILEKYKNLRGLYVWENLFKSGKIKKSRKKIVHNLKSCKVDYEERIHEQEMKSYDPDDIELLSEEEKKQLTYFDEDATYKDVYRGSK